MNQMKLQHIAGSVRSGINRCLVVFWILTLALMGVSARAQAEADVSAFEEAKCPMPLPGDFDVTCGYPSVPEIHGESYSPTIRLAVAILRSHSDHPQPDPVVHVHGGPGQGDLQRFFGYLNAPFLAERDLILMD